MWRIIRLSYRLQVVARVFGSTCRIEISIVGGSAHDRREAQPAGAVHPSSAGPRQEPCVPGLAGGALLGRLQGMPDPEDSHFPEEWVGSTTVTRLPGRPAEEGLSRVLFLDGSTQLLKTLIEAYHEAMLGTEHVTRYGAELGVPCKLLDAGMRLSIQADPNRAFARAHLHSEFGKTESWLVIGTRVINGEPP